jgi:hypothetical protein
MAIILVAATLVIVAALLALSGIFLNEDAIIGIATALYVPAIVLLLASLLTL